MIRYRYTLFACLFVSLLSNCQNGQKTTDQTTSSTAVAAESEPVSTEDVDITERMANLGLTPDSDWRGININDAFTHVKAVEKGDPFESDAEHIGYTIELKNLESSDVLYYQTNQKVSAIDVDLFLNTRQSVTEYRKELEAYFTARYGTPKPGSAGLNWAGSGETVSLKDVSKGKDFGLKVKIASAGGVATASAK